LRLNYIDLVNIFLVRSIKLSIIFIIRKRERERERRDVLREQILRYRYQINQKNSDIFNRKKLIISFDNSYKNFDSFMFEQTYRLNLSDFQIMQPDLFYNVRILLVQNTKRNIILRDYQDS